MPKVTLIVVTDEERLALEKGARDGTTYSFRLRCQAVLLKTQKYTSLEVAQQLGCCEMSVNNWLKRYQEQELAGLRLKAGRGRKAILQKETDLAAVRHAVEQSSQRLSLRNVWRISLDDAVVITMLPCCLISKYFYSNLSIMQLFSV